MDVLIRNRSRGQWRCLYLWLACEGRVVLTDTTHCVPAHAFHTPSNPPFPPSDVVKITCDANSSLEVGNGQNVTIHCQASPDARYTWTKVTDAIKAIYPIPVDFTSIILFIYSITPPVNIKMIWLPLTPRNLRFPKNTHYDLWAPWFCFSTERGGGVTEWISGAAVGDWCSRRSLHADCLHRKWNCA